MVTSEHATVISHCLTDISHGNRAPRKKTNTCCANGKPHTKTPRWQHDRVKLYRDCLVATFRHRQEICTSIAWRSRTLVNRASSQTGEYLEHIGIRQLLLSIFKPESLSSFFGRRQRSGLVMLITFVLAAAYRTNREATPAPDAITKENWLKASRRCRPPINNKLKQALFILTSSINADTVPLNAKDERNSDIEPSPSMRLEIPRFPFCSGLYFQSHVPL